MHEVRGELDVADYIGADHASPAVGELGEAMSRSRPQGPRIPDIFLALTKCPIQIGLVFSTSFLRPSVIFLLLAFSVLASQFLLGDDACGSAG